MKGKISLFFIPSSSSVPKFVYSDSEASIHGTVNLQRNPEIYFWIFFCKLKTVNRLMRLLFGRKLLIATKIGVLCTYQGGGLAPVVITTSLQTP